MDLVNLTISYEFLARKTRLTWQEGRFGLVNELIEPTVLIELATYYVGETDQPSSALVELAWAAPDDWIREHLDELASGETPVSEAELLDKWLYLALAWTYENRHLYADSLEQVQLIYADFGYPAHIADLSMLGVRPVRGAGRLWTESQNSERGVLKQGVQGLYERWQRYLDESQALYGPGILE